MSLILDALRKSEAERRRGAPPDLFAAHPQPTLRPRAWPLRWLVPIAAVLLAALAWGAWSVRVGAGHPGSTLAPFAGAADEPEPELEPDQSVGGRAAFAAVRAAAAPPTRASSPSPSLSASPDLAARRAASAQHRATEEPAPFGRAPAIAAASLPNTASARPLPSPAAPVQGSAAAASGPQSAVADAARTDAPAADPSLPTLASLEASERNALPPLRLSMHVWDAQPARRFAIIDGQRVAEGSLVGNSVVAQIRRDGVVLDVGGRSILIPRP